MIIIKFGPYGVFYTKAAENLIISSLEIIDLFIDGFPRINIIILFYGRNMVTIS